MKAYNCIVRPAGQITHEVPKTKVSAKEIMLLRFIHGQDAVIKIQHVGTLKRRDDDGGTAEYTEQDALRHMAREYGAPLVQKVFNTYVDDLSDSLDEGDREQYLDIRVVEADAKGEEVDVRQVAQEAGSVRPAPAKVDTGPYYANQEAREAEANASPELA